MEKVKSKCKSCGTPVIKEPVPIEPPKPEIIYKRVLEIGSECITCGISFNDLYQRLQDEGFEFDEGGCLKRCLREWFWCSFFHEEAHCVNDNTKVDIKKLDKHLNCNFILKAESCMKLLTFKEAENNVKTASENALTAKRSNNVALIALAISILGLGYGLYHDKDELEYNKAYNLQQEKTTKEMQNIEQHENAKLDTIASKVQVLYEYLKEQQEVSPHTNK